MAEYIGKLIDVNHIPATASIIAVGGRREEVGGGGWVGRKAVFSLPTAPPRKKKEFLYPLCTCPQTLAELTYLSKIIRPNHAI